MNKYIVKISVVMEGAPANSALGIIVYAASSTDADTAFRTFYPGFINAGYSYSISLSV